MIGSARAGFWVMVLVTALWATSFPLISEAVEGRGAGELFLFLSLRFSLATLAFLPILPQVVRSTASHGLGAWGHASLVGVLLFLGYLTQTVGLVHTTPARSAFITMISVPLVPFFAALWQRRALSRVHVWGSLLALVGVGFVLAPDGSFEPNSGDAWTLACAGLFALEILTLERVTRLSPVSILAVGQIGTVALLSLVGLAVFRVDFPASWPGLWVGVVVTGVVCTTLAIGGMVWAQKRVRAEVAALVFALEPVFASLFDYGYTGRGLTAWQLVGGAVVVLAVILTARAPVPGEVLRAS